MTARARALALGRVVAVATLPLIAPLTPLAILALGAVQQRRAALLHGLRWGLVVWGGYAMLLTPVLLSTPGPLRWLPLTQALVGAAAMALLRAPRGVVVAGALTALTVLAAAGVGERWLEARSWQLDRVGGVERVGVGPAGSVDRIVGFGGASSARMDWAAPRGNGADVVRLSFEARAAQGPFGWDFVRSAAVAARDPHDGGHGTRITTEATGDPYLVKRYALPSGIAGETFDARLELRSATGRDVCGRIYLGPPGGRRAASTEACAGSTWRPATVLWNAPADAAGERLDLIVNDFDGVTFEIRAVDLRIRNGSKARSLEVPFPEGARVRVTADGEDLGEIAFEPSPTWRGYHAELPLPAGTERIRLRAFTESGSSVLVSNVSVSTGRRAWRPLAVSKRASLWYPAPNLLGHTAAATAAVVILHASQPVTVLLGAGFGILLVLLSGSRAALLVMVLAIALATARRGAPWNDDRGPLARWWPILGGSALVVLAIAALLATGLFRFLPAEAESVSRVAIWRSALDAFSAHPLSGLWGNGASFAQDFQVRNPGVEEVVLHAHNLWLQLGAVYGVLGFAASAWLCVGLGVYAFRSRGGTGLALSVCVLVLNLVDSTLFYFGVLYPFLLALNAEDARADATARGRPAPPSAVPGALVPEE